MEINYYICSLDVLPHLSGREFLYVWKHNLKISHMLKNTSSDKMYIDYVDVLDFKITPGLCILLKDLNNEEISFLTLSCKSIISCNTKHFTQFLNACLCDNNIWLTSSPTI